MPMRYIVQGLSIVRSGHTNDDFERAVKNGRSDCRPSTRGGRDTNCAIAKAGEEMRHEGVLSHEVQP